MTDLKPKASGKFILGRPVNTSENALILDDGPMNALVFEVVSVGEECRSEIKDAKFIWTAARGPLVDHDGEQLEAISQDGIIARC